MLDQKLVYYGVKLHALAFRRLAKISFPEEIQITPASLNDLNVCKEAWSEKTNRNFFIYKIYIDKNFFSELEQEKNSIKMTPIERIKGQYWEIKNWNKASNDLFSTAVSRGRQPIESLFNWLIVKTVIQKASKVISTKCLIIHLFGKIAPAFISLIF